jgi:hypothetical protein
MVKDYWNPLGANAAKKFKVGDLVSWKLLGPEKNKDFGIIIEISEAPRGGRAVILAKMVRFRDNNTTLVPIMSIKKVVENKSNEI